MVYLSDFLGDALNIANKSLMHEWYADAWNVLEDTLQGLHEDKRKDILKEAYELSVDHDASNQEKLAAQVIISMIED